MARPEAATKLMEEIEKRAANGGYGSPQEAHNDLVLLDMELSYDWSKTSPRAEGWFWYRDHKGGTEDIMKIFYENVRWKAMLFGGGTLDISQLVGQWSPVRRP